MTALSQRAQNDVPQSLVCRGVKGHRSCHVTVAAAAVVTSIVAETIAAQSSDTASAVTIVGRSLDSQQSLFMS